MNEKQTLGEVRRHREFQVRPPALVSAVGFGSDAIIHLLAAVAQRCSIRAAIQRYPPGSHRFLHEFPGVQRRELMKFVTRKSRLKQMSPGFCLPALLLISFVPARMPADATAAGVTRPVSAIAAAQNPTEAETYRKLAAAKRKAAQNVPAKRECYLAWARYYDCLAAKIEAGDNRDCGKQPDDC